MTGNEEEHHIGSAVLIGVILAEVHLRVKGLKSGKEDGVAIELVGIGAGEGNVHGTQDVEVRVKLLERVVVVVVAHTAHALNLGSRRECEALVVMAIDHSLVKVYGRVVPRNVIIKFPVGVVDQDDQATELAVVHVTTMTNTAYQVVALVEQLGTTLYLVLAGQTLGYASEIGFIVSGAVVARDAVTCNQLVTVETGIGVITCLILDHGVTIEGRQVVKKLVTVELHGNRCSIRLCHLSGSRICRGRMCKHTHHSHCNEQ